MSQASGKDGPRAARRERRQYSAEFKAAAVDLVRRRRAQGRSVAHVARELEITPGLLWEWVRKLDPAAARHGQGVRVGGSRDQPAAPGETGETLEEEVRRLRREVVTLRQEREFAKKAAAFFLTESL